MCMEVYIYTQKETHRETYSYTWANEREITALAEEDHQAHRGRRLKKGFDLPARGCCRAWWSRLATRIVL